MDTTTILRRLDYERRTLERAGDLLTALPHLVRVCSTENTRHQVAWSDLNEASADSAIAGEIEHRRRIGKSFEWKVYSHDHPPDLLVRLRSHGFTIGPKETVLVFDLAKIDSIQSASESMATVERVATADQLVDFKTTAGQVFGKDFSMTTDELAAALTASSTEHWGYVAYASANGNSRSARNSAAVGRLYTHPESWFGGLFGGGTVAEFRGQGHYRATVAARARDAVRLGAKYLMIDALPTSQPIVERMGFVRIADTWPAVYEPASA